MCGYILVNQPYSERVRNKQELFNEICILISIYTLTGFTHGYNTDLGRFDEGRVCMIEELAGKIEIYPNEQCAKDFVSNMKEFQYYIGWATIGIFVLNVLCNLGYITFKVVKTAIK